MFCGLNQDTGFNKYFILFPSVKITKLLPMEINSSVLRWVVEDYEIYIILLYTGSVFAWYSLQDIWKWRNEEHGGELQIEGLHGKETFKTESIRKLSNFTFQWMKTLYQNNFKHTGSFFTLFEGYKCNKLYEITPKKRFLWES